MPEKEFNEKAPIPPEELATIFDLPSGMAMEKLGVLTKAQVAQSGKIQAAMLAIKNKLQSGGVAEKLVKEQVGNFKGSIDFLGLASKQDNIPAILDALGISAEELAVAQGVIDRREGVNIEGDAIIIPPMGQIHNKLYVDHPTNQGFLTVQQSIRAANTALRLARGDVDPDMHERRREFTFPNDRDDVRLQVIQTVHQALSYEESKGAGVGGDPSYLATYGEKIKQGFADAADMFEAAEKEQIAQYVRRAANYFGTQFNSVQPDLGFKFDESTPA